MIKPHEVKIQPMLVDILSAGLGVAREEISEDFSAEACPAWDSVRHITLILAIEDRFGIKFDESDIWSLFSIAELSQAVVTRLNSTD